MSLTLQREAVLKNACAVVPRSNSNFGLEEGLEAEADRRAACEGFMGGLLKGGEYAGTRFFLQLSRTYALRSSRDPHGSPVVSCVGKDHHFSVCTVDRSRWPVQPCSWLAHVASPTGNRAVAAACS